MTRRTALLAALAVVGQILRDDAVLRGQSLVFSSWPKGPERLRVQLGGPDGYQYFDFAHGPDTVTITADELFAALKGDQP